MGSGRPGSLPTRGSHRSGRARLTHPAPQDDGFATQRSNTVAHPPVQQAAVLAWPARLSAEVSLRHFRTSVFPASFSSTGPYIPMPPSLDRVSRAGFPCVIGTMRHSDSLPPIPPHFVSFAWRYRSCVACLLAAGRDAPPVRLGFDHRSPDRTLERRRRGLPGS